MAVSVKVEGSVEVLAGKATKALVAVVDEFAEVKAQIAELEAKSKALREVILDARKGADVLTYNGVEVVRFDDRGRTNVDSKALATLYPEVYAVVAKSQTITYVVNVPRRK
jgi:hypothetical protein